MQLFNEPWEAKVRKNKQLASTFAAALAMTTLFGASAFAESRPANETRTRSERGDGIRRERDANGGESRRGDDSRNRDNGGWRGDSSARGQSPGRIEPRDTVQSRDRVEARDRVESRNRVETGDRSQSGSRGEYRNDTRNRNDSRNRGDWSNNRNDSRNRGDWNNNRNDSRNRGDWNNNRNDSRGRGGYDRSSSYRQPYYTSGRVSRVDRYGSGYRVWVVGANYPFFVPLAYYRHDRFRVGVSIQLGGYYNPGGYYDYYDGVYDGRAYSRGDLRGVVESVDYRRDTFVVRNDASGSFVTVVARDRRRDDVRPGDYVEIAGDWTRSGVFQAYQVDVLDYDNYRR